jgi:hypothetical protein
MPTESRISLSLVLLRVGVFIVMLVWTFDKFINPAHAIAVYANFYSLRDLAPAIIYTIAAIELVIIVGFVLGIYKTFTYGAVLLFHALSTLVAYKQYFSPYGDANILFFAAWPMLAACAALFLLKDLDKWWVVERV